MARKANEAAGAGQVLAPGYVVALALKEGTAPLRCHVGQIQAVDQHGVRVTLVDGITGRFQGWDFFAPWESTTAALVATPQHDVPSFGNAADDFQVRCDHMAEGREAMERAAKEAQQLRDRVRRG